VDRSVPTVFISYRRHDTPLAAELLSERLRGRFRVFFDLDEIELGTEFITRIQQELSAADVVLAVIGKDWNPARLAEPDDVLAYELRLARRFERRVIPVIIGPAGVPAAASLPDDLQWLSRLNAFIVPEPPGHSAAMVQLADLLEKKPATSAAPTAFAIPQDAEMLRRQEGNIRFEEADAIDAARLCSIASDGSAVWLASSRAVELRAFANGATLCRSKPSNPVEWLHRTKEGAVMATSGMGYHAPDTIRFARLACRDGALDETDSGFGWSWTTPPLALSPDEKLLAGYLETPNSRGSHIGFYELATGELLDYLDTAAETSSLAFAATGDRLYALAWQSDERRLLSIDVASRTVSWSRALEADLFDKASTLRYWSCQDSLLLVVGSDLYELDASSGSPQRRILTLPGKVSAVATDRASSLGCAVDDTAVIVFSGRSRTEVSLAHGGTRALACDVCDRHIVVLVEDGDSRRLLIAQDVPETLDGPVTE
jgi:hypothetical protein